MLRTIESPRPSPFFFGRGGRLGETSQKIFFNRPSVAGNDEKRMRFCEDNRRRDRGGDFRREMAVRHLRVERFEREF